VCFAFSIVSQPCSASAVWSRPYVDTPKSYPIWLNPDVRKYSPGSNGLTGTISIVSPFRVIRRSVILGDRKLAVIGLLIHP
jgi:hypothetical protein